jgi:putative transposase
VRGAAYGTSSPDRVNRRNGYCARQFDTRAGTRGPQVPKLRTGPTSPSGCWNAASGPSGR